MKLWEPFQECFIRRELRLGPVKERLIKKSFLKKSLPPTLASALSVVPRGSTSGARLEAGIGLRSTTGIYRGLNPRSGFGGHLTLLPHNTEKENFLYNFT